ncbi:MAG: beta-lactamase family protein [Gemmatimonadetes bacterium]|nr:beta-lactamase family protein [Gemmatimonadota bacterium]
MKRRSPAALPGLLVVLSILSLSCGSSERQDRASAPAPRDLSGIIVPLLQKGRLPALGAAIVTADGLEAVGAVGVRSWTATEKVTIDDQWHIGSCTNAMTATLVARLVDRGVLSWDTTIGAVIGPAIHPAWKDVPILWLLTHRSGAPLNFSEDLWQQMVARGGSPREQRRWFVEQGLRSAPATTPEYRERLFELGLPCSRSHDRGVDRFSPGGPDAARSLRAARHDTNRIRRARHAGTVESTVGTHSWSGWMVARRPRSERRQSRRHRTGGNDPHDPR